MHITLKRLALLLAVGLIATAASTAMGQASDDDAQGKFLLGITGTDTDGYLGRVAEYELAQQGVLPLLKAHGSATTKGLYLDFDVINRGNARDQFYRLNLEAGRVFTTRFLINNFIHRLDHDPYANMDTTQRSGALISYADDLAPAHEYRNDVSEIVSQNTIRIPALEWLSVHVDYRRLDREGDRQGSSLSKCYGCHVTTQPRPVDETLNEVKATVAASTERFGVEYSFLYRQNQEATDSIYYLYDPAIHPATLLDVFTNRVLYDNTNGPLPGNSVPDIEKKQHYAKAYFNINDSTRLLGSASYAEVENQSTGLSTTSQYYTGRFTTLLPKNMVLNARVRYGESDNEDVYVDLVEMVANAGPQAGRTYAQAYPTFGSADFIRYSSLNREEVDIAADLLVPLPDRNKLGFTYAFHRTDRTHYDLDATDQHRFTVLFRSDPRKPLSVNARYRFEMTDNPFINNQAAIEPVLQPYASPGGVPFGGTQYFTLYEARLANLTNRPTRSHNLDVSATWKPVKNAGVTGHYIYRHLSNDELNYSDWSQTYQMIGGSVYYIPEQRVSFTAGATYADSKTETLLVNPVWNG